VTVAAVATTVWLARDDGRERSGSSPVDFTPGDGSVVPADIVRDRIVAAIEQLTSAPFVSIESVGYTEGRRSDIVADVDRVAQRMTSIELVTENADVGEPRSAAPVVSELVLIGNDGWLRVLQPTQARDTPYQFIDATGSTEQYLQGAYTQLGRVFDSLTQLSALLATTPFRAERLERRTVDTDAVEGVKATFSTSDVGDFLDGNGLAAVESHDLAGETTFELWFDATGLRELVATGLQFQDGEALETSARIIYRVRQSLKIEAPGNTLPR
jgi:hypothetical protein